MPAASPSPARFILPAAVLGLLAGGILMAARALQRETITVSEVRREIEARILAAESIGPWQVGATDRDPSTGALTGFTLQSRDLQLAAARARVSVDAENDTFTIHLESVTYFSAPSVQDGEQPLVLTERPFLDLGPAEYKLTIVEDE